MADEKITRCSKPALPFVNVTSHKDRYKVLGSRPILRYIRRIVREKGAIPIPSAINEAWRTTMKPSRILFIGILIHTFFISASYAKIPEVVLAQKDAVVTIYIEDNNKVVAFGSGFIITSDGVIVTNNHVIEPWNTSTTGKLYVKRSDGVFLEPVEILATDNYRDVALIKVKDNNLPYIQINSGYKANQGDDVAVIGTPLGFETTITTGIVSGIRGEDGFLQISAPISPGSSGSPVLNSKGEAIGVATLIITAGQNLNFAIPATYVSNLLASESNAEDNKTSKALPAQEQAIQPKALAKYTDDEILPPELTSAERKLGKHRGKVVSTTNVDGHTYIKYREDGTESWVVTNKTTIMVSDIIDFYRNASQRKFWLNTLNIPPDQIAFVDYIRIVHRDSKYFKELDEYYRFVVDQAMWEGDYGNHEYVARVLTKAIANKPDNHRLYYERYYAYWRQLTAAPAPFNGFNNDLDMPPAPAPEVAPAPIPATELCNSALRDINKAIEYSDKVEAYYVKRAEILSDSTYCAFNDINGALKDYDIAIKLNPKSAEYHMKKGWIYDQQKDYPRVLECAKKAVDINPKDAGGYYLYGRYYEANKNYSKALEYYKKGLAQGDNEIGTLYIDKIIDKTNKFDEAVKLYGELIKVKPEDQLFYSERAKYYVMQEKYSNAIADYTVAIQRTQLTMSGYLYDVIASNHYYYRGNAYLAIEKKREALADFQAACSQKMHRACAKADDISDELILGENWVKVTTTNYSKVFLGKDRLSKNSKGVISAWVRHQITDADSYIKHFDYSGKGKEKYKEISHVLQRFHFDCTAEKYSINADIAYDKKGNVIRSFNYDKAEYEFVIPDSIGEGLYKNVCSENKASKSEKAIKLKK